MVQICSKTSNTQTLTHSSVPWGPALNTGRGHRQPPHTASDITSAIGQSRTWYHILYSLHPSVCSTNRVNWAVNSILDKNRISLGLHVLVYYFTFSKGVFAITIITTDCKVWIHIKTTELKYLVLFSLDDDPEEVETCSVHHRIFNRY